MNKIDDATDVYNKIEIPKELDALVKKTIQEHSEKEIGKETETVIHRFPICKAAAYAAAAAVICFTVALNTSEAFAKGAGSVPFIGGIAKVLTVRSYEAKEDDKNISVQVPAIEVSGTEEMQTENTDAGEEQTAQQNKLQLLEAQKFTGDINAEIEKIVDDYVADAKQRYDDYKEAFFATGGTQEEWDGRDMDIDVDYEIKYQQGSVLSFILTTTEAWCAVYGEQYYYNLDLAQSKKLTLQDVLGDDYVQIANQAIIEQIHQRIAEEKDYVYWGFMEDELDDIDGMEGFQSVDEETLFYMNEKGNPVVCFPKYEISPGFMGVQEFEIVQ